MKIAWLQDGEWIHVKRKDMLVCCDCGLVHNIELKVKSDRVYLRVFQNLKATNVQRKKLLKK